MFFALDDDQREFDAAVRTFLAERFDLDAVRAVVEAPDSDGHPAALWKAAAEQGWLAVTVPEEHDGLGLGLLEAQVIARALAPERRPSVAGHGARAPRPCAWPAPRQKATWLPRLASGGTRGRFTRRGSAPARSRPWSTGRLADSSFAPGRGGLAPW
jgi:alkylation response protein AidB-like acyl-CoA dehydrogenase